MGTRAIIGTANDSGFEGRYTHWDGYPSHHGPTLFNTYRELGQDVHAALEYAVRPGAKGYWSSFLSPSDAAAEDTKPAKVPCELCAGTGTRPNDAHWKAGSPQAKCCNGCNGCSGTGMTSNRHRMDHWRTDNGDSWATNTDDWGAEWAYLLSDSGVTVLHATWTETGGAAWHRVDHVSWDSEPDWAALDAACNQICATG